MTPGVVDDDAPHHLAGRGEEVLAVAPVGAAGVDEPEIGFVNERRRIEARRAPAANALLRKRLEALAHRHEEDVHLRTPPASCVDEEPG